MSEGPHESTGGPLPALLKRLVGPLAILAIGTFLLLDSWGMWPDVLIDFGRELYVPWQLSQGKVLYVDIAHFNGPLSPYWNSLWFQIFGVGLQTLVASNLLILVGLTVLLHRILEPISDRFSATAACLIFISVFAFVQIDRMGNYNYVTPYSHEITHGLALSCLAIYCFYHYRRRGLAALLASGFCLGLVFLTKAENFVAAAGALAVGLGLALFAEPREAGRALGHLGGFAAAVAVPPVLALIFLSEVMPFDAALRGTLGPWPSVFNSELANQHFYRRGLGTINLGGNLELAALTGFAYLGLFVPVALFALWIRRWKRFEVPIAAALFLVLLYPLSRVPQFYWVRANRPATLLMIALLIVHAAAFVKTRKYGGDTNTVILRLTVVTFATLLLAKIFFNVRFLNYGFALAMPATLLTVVTLTSWIPLRIERAGGSGWVFRAASVAALVMLSLSLLQITDSRFRKRIHHVGEGGDAFLAGDRAPLVNAVLRDLEERLDPEDTLLVLPEGVMINYLARRVNPTPYINFMPPELIIFGERAILEAFRADPPDYVLLVHKKTVEYGALFFGRGYGRRLLAWVKAHYHPVRLFGEPPLRVGTRFGIRVLKRRDAPEDGG
jgi:4-amino-4-deoxy-L-arabinose transferase-like glycosyltransferase